MIFNKIYWGKKDNLGASISSNIYTRSLAHVQKMLVEIKKDYPDLELTPDDITIVIYSGERCKGMMGLEFHITSPAKGYTKEDPSTLY